MEKKTLIFDSSMPRELGFAKQAVEPPKQAVVLPKQAVVPPKQAVEPPKQAVVPPKQAAEPPKPQPSVTVNSQEKVVSCLIFYHE